MKRKRRSPVPATVAVIVALWGRAASAQVPPEPPNQEIANVSFELVTVRENPLTRREAGPPAMSMSQAGRFVAARETVSRLIQVAYTLRPFQVVDGPTWITSTLYDIQANAPERFEIGQTQDMMRRLLADRFGLRVRRELRVMPTYSLEWADRNRKLGPGIRPSARCDDSGPGASNGSGQPKCESGYGISSEGLFVLRNPISSLLTLLTAQTERPVIDKTGLTGVYDIDVRLPGGLSPGRPQTDFGLDGSLFTAVREQLGLKLTPATEKVEVLVIQAVERPAPN
jgi:uncharacterized protein (TIGR03435 family)